MGAIAAQTHQKSSLTFIFEVVTSFGTILAFINHKNISRSHYFQPGLLCKPYSRLQRPAYIAGCRVFHERARRRQNAKDLPS